MPTYTHSLNSFFLVCFTEVPNLFRSAFSTEGNLELPLAFSSILSFLEYYTVAVYLSFRVFSSLLSFLQYGVSEGSL
jgi:hypothetical protein